MDVEEEVGVEGQVDAVDDVDAEAAVVMAVPEFVVSVDEEVQQSPYEGGGSCGGHSSNRHDNIYDDEGSNELYNACACNGHIYVHGLVHRR
jgi:hypothetical protein